MLLFIRFLFLYCAFCVSSFATVIQILHTNDMHSYFEHGVHAPGRGGYANLKTAIAEEKALATAQGIPTVVVDAGDFMEGHLFYMANRGRKSLDLLNLMGFDIATIGNHDYLMGIDGLEQLLKDSPPKFALLGANLRAAFHYENVRKVIKPYHIMQFGSAKVAFLGLTTDNVYFTWRIKHIGGGISDPIRSAKHWVKILKEQEGVDIIIALNHLGLNTDRKLVRKVPEIDLIVGGHSHNFLERPVYVSNKHGKKVAIVQAGQHAEALGRLKIKIEAAKTKRESKKFTLGVQDYSLRYIVDEGKPDPEVASLVQEAREDLYDLYGKEWMTRQIGYSKLSPHSTKSQIEWCHFIADAMREAFESDIAIHATGVVGINYPVGVIRREDILNGHPRFLDLKNHGGSALYKVSIPGWMVWTLFEATRRWGRPMVASGVKIKWRYRSDYEGAPVYRPPITDSLEDEQIPKPASIPQILDPEKVNYNNLEIESINFSDGQLKYFKYYDVVIAEELARGTLHTFSQIFWILDEFYQTDKNIIEVIEQKILRNNHPKINSLLPKPGTTNDYEQLFGDDVIGTAPHSFIYPFIAI